MSSQTDVLISHKATLMQNGFLNELQKPGEPKVGGFGDLAA